MIDKEKIELLNLRKRVQEQREIIKKLQEKLEDCQNETRNLQNERLYREH